MNTITASELKTRGVTAIDAALSDNEEVTISVRGMDRYVVMNVSTYNRLRVCELETALQEAHREIANGQGIVESVDAHLLRVAKLNQ
jgi:PHD/YefM family antitoxin component YafN of YafNO toxin-antitoxin module